MELLKRRRLDNNFKPTGEKTQKKKEFPHNNSRILIYIYMNEYIYIVRVVYFMYLVSGYLVFPQVKFITRA